VELGNLTAKERFESQMWIHRRSHGEIEGFAESFWKRMPVWIRSYAFVMSRRIPVNGCLLAGSTDGREVMSLPG
jgi:hypothetical protein